MPADGEGAAELAGRGYYWQELEVGVRFRTFARTVTEADIIGFVGVTGMVETIFVDTSFQHGAIRGRPAPAALVYALMEGLIIQALIQGTGLALLEMEQQVHAPVLVNDTVHAVIELTALRPTSKSGRAVSTWRVEVFNQRDERVMTYVAKRLLAGRPS